MAGGIQYIEQRQSLSKLERQDKVTINVMI